MRKIVLISCTLIVGIAVAVVVERSIGAQAPRQTSPSTQAPAPIPSQGTPSAVPFSVLESSFLDWQLPANAQAYADIDGKRAYRDVVDQVAISRRYRDAGHAFWGRIIGTSSDAESAEWVASRFKAVGLSDVRVQPLDLAPQYVPNSWEITAAGGGKTVRLESAWPATSSEITPAEGLDLEAVYVGMGSEAEYVGRDVRGKAVFIYNPPRPGGGERGADERAQQKGAAAIIEVDGLPGNIKTQINLTSSATPVRRINVPIFSMGRQDGFTVRDMIVAGQPPPRVKIRLDAKLVPNLKTATVWGMLPGATDETVYVIAHRDGYFDAATDNASGVATMIELAAHFAKIPQAQRRRTMYFLGISGHHPPPQNPTVDWLMEHKAEVFAKTALVINSEHTSTLQTYLRGDSIRRANTYTGQLWYGGGATRPKLQEIASKAFREFGVPVYAEPEQPGPPGSDLSMKNFWRYVPGVMTMDMNIFFHTDQETPETVPWSGLQAMARAYARLIDEVNKLPLADLQRPPELPQGTASRP